MVAINPIFWNPIPSKSMDDSQLKKLTQVTSPTQQLVVEYEMSSAESEEVEESSDDESILRFHAPLVKFNLTFVETELDRTGARWSPVPRRGS